MIDFKTAKEIVLALKKIAANISSDKSNSNNNNNNNTDTNTDTNNDGLNYVIFNQTDLGYGMFESSMFFTLENNDLDNIKNNVYTGNESTLGELFASDTLIKLFNKAIEHINYMINERGYTTGDVYMVYNMDNNDGNQSDGVYGNLKRVLGNTIVSSDLNIRIENGETYKLTFKNSNEEVIAWATTTTIFDENTPITTSNGGGR